MSALRGSKTIEIVRSWEGFHSCEGRLPSDISLYTGFHLLGGAGGKPPPKKQKFKKNLKKNYIPSRNYIIPSIKIW